MSSTTNRYLCFRVGQEEFAIPLLSVKQVIALPEITPVPQVPNYFLGIMNLRGQVISVLDLRLKLGVRAGESSEKSVIIFDLESHCLGLVVDEVESVLTVDPAQLSAPPDLGRSAAGEFITSICRHEDRLVLMVDIVRMLSKEDRNAVKSA